jgi:uncharacterized lipoprotein YmbA
MKHRSFSLIAPVCLAALAACTVLPPREDATRYFVLSASAPASSAPTADPSLGLIVGPVRLPDYLLRPEIVRRAGENQLEPSSIDRWAEPIDHAMVRILCRDLSSLLPMNTVVAFPLSPPETAILQVDVEIAAFEGDRAGKVRLEGRWTLRDLRTGSQVVRAARLDRASSSAETPAVVASMSALLGDLAAAIAREAGSLTK